ICRQLAGQGFRVALGARDTERGETAAAQLRSEGLDVEWFPIDMRDSATLTAAPHGLQSRYGRLDALVNNAGILPDRGVPASELEDAVLRDVFEVNFFGVWTLTAACMPLLRQSDAPRIVNMSSVLGSLAEVSRSQGWVTPAYTASKVALNAITVLFGKELGPTGKVNSAHPGYVRTDMTGPEAPMTPEQGAKTAVWLATLPEDGPSLGLYHGQKLIAW
ncbi:MAG: SDR family oxidoreductase, partial [Fimbriimonadaceae bacterium]|nr:SDR family oxidoreductase [Fimbriimonadaceae bacterium]